MNRIAIIAFNTPTRYSGGRIHALWLAYGFAANGIDVDYYTNCIPVFLKDLPDAHKNLIHFYVNSIFCWNPQYNNYRQIIVVPHLATWKKEFVDRILFYPFVSRLKEKSRCPMWYLDFESPNWIQETDPSLRSLNRYRNSNRILKKCDIVLSTTKIGKSYAEKYYTKYNKRLVFFQLYLAINTYVAKDINIMNKIDHAMLIARFGQKHKNNEAIINIVESLPNGFALSVLGDCNAAEPEFIDKITKQCKEKKIKLSFFKNITDREKFELLSKTRLFFFSSKFEGYGLPPLEAQYMGASVVCSDLPVLREVNPMATFIDFNNQEQLNNAVNKLLYRPQDPNELRKNVEKIASPEVFFSNLGKIINEIE